MPSRFISTKQVADTFEVSPKTVRRWIAADILPAESPCGGPYRIPRTAVDEFEQRCWRSTGRPAPEPTKPAQPADRSLADELENLDRLLDSAGW